MKPRACVFAALSGAPDEELVETETGAPWAQILPVGCSGDAVHRDMAYFCPQRVEIMRELISDVRGASCHDHICDMQERGKTESNEVRNWVSDSDRFLSPNHDGSVSMTGRHCVTRGCGTRHSSGSQSGEGCTTHHVLTHGQPSTRRSSPALRVVALSAFLADQLVPGVLPITLLWIVVIVVISLSSHYHRGDGICWKDRETRRDAGLTLVAVTTLPFSSREKVRSNSIAVIFVVGKKQVGKWVVMVWNKK
jgi:hypothetical protein